MGVLRALGLPGLRPKTSGQVKALTRTPMDDDKVFEEFFASEDIAPLAELRVLGALPPCARACANAALHALHPDKWAAPSIGVPGFGDKLRHIFREVFGLQQTLDELAVAGCPWLRLPDVGVLDLGTCWNALREHPACRAGLVPAGHPLRDALETPLLIAVLVAAPDGKEGFSASVRQDVAQLGAVVQDSTVFSAPRKHVVRLSDCCLPEQLFDVLDLPRMVRMKGGKNE